MEKRGHGVAGGRGGRWALAAIAILALAIVAERMDWAGALRARRLPERTWLWIGGDPRDPRPVAFFALRDFDLREKPGRATIEVLGDEEYILSLNGFRIGSNRYRAGAALDRYEVERWLVRGANRLVVELRSSTAAGAFSLRLIGGAGEDLLAGAPPWGIHRNYFKALFPGGEAPPAPEPVRLGTAPLGRWGLPAPGPLRPAFEDLLAVPRVVPAVRYRAGRESEGVEWHRLRTKGRRRASLGSAVLFDFGAPVVGYLQLEVRGRDSATGLLRFSLEPDPEEPGAVHGLATTLPLRGLWQDAVARRFRYVEVLGLGGVTAAGVLPLVEDAIARLGGEEGPGGLLGIEPPPLRAPVENVIRRELESEPGLALGESR